MPHGGLSPQKMGLLGLLSALSTVWPCSSRQQGLPVAPRAGQRRRHRAGGRGAQPPGEPAEGVGADFPAPREAGECPWKGRRWVERAWVAPTHGRVGVGGAARAPIADPRNLLPPAPALVRATLSLEFSCLRPSPIPSAMGPLPPELSGLSLGSESPLPGAGHPQGRVCAGLPLPRPAPAPHTRWVEAESLVAQSFLHLGAAGLADPSRRTDGSAFPGSVRGHSLPSETCVLSSCGPPGLGRAALPTSA